VFCLFSGFDSVYALVNNAGIFYEPFYQTEDDFDATFQTNYLGKNSCFKSASFLYVFSSKYWHNLLTIAKNRLIFYFVFNYLKVKIIE